MYDLHLEKRHKLYTSSACEAFSRGAGTLVLTQSGFGLVKPGGFPIKKPRNPPRRKQAFAQAAYRFGRQAFKVTLTGL
jgi:hypothetical protein